MWMFNAAIVIVIDWIGLHSFIRLRQHFPETMLMLIQNFVCIPNNNQAHISGTKAKHFESENSCG